MKTSFVIFDRDGTLIEHIHYLVDPNLVKFKEDIIPSLTSLQKNGFKFGIITNQSVIGRGLASHQTVNKINNKITQYLESHKILITFILICPHTPSDDCDCRKPKPGMLLAASKKKNINLKNSYMIGDRWTDIEAGNSAGCKTIFVDYNYKEKRPFNYKYKVKSLKEATNIILKNE
jgi:D-glycero-D-manno-heptose 1,7-bisphosphate phosphatase